MRRFVPIRAEGGLVLGLIAVIAGTTFIINELSEPSIITQTTYGTPQVRIERVDQGGVKPGPVQPRVVAPVVAAPVQEFAPAPVATPKPVKPPKKTVVATTPNPVVVTPDPAPVDPGEGGLLPATEPGAEPIDPGTGTAPGGTGPGTGPGKNPDACLLAPLCAPTQPTGRP